MTKFVTLIGLAAASALSLSACSPQPNAQATPAATDTAAQNVEETSAHPISGLAVIPLTITTSKGTETFAVELADTPTAQARGLMFRTEMGDFEGMIFPSNPPQERGFWMKNTPLPLDIIYVGTDNRILNIHAMTTPYSLDSLLSNGVALGVLELRGGRSEELGIEPGDLVEW